MSETHVTVEASRYEALLAAERELQSARERMAGLEQDAKRYRWLRDSSEIEDNVEDETGHYVCLSIWKGPSEVVYEAGFGQGELDAAIDNAMEGT